MSARGGDHAGVSWRALCLVRHRIRLHHHAAVGRLDGELVSITDRSGLGNAGPHAGLSLRCEHVAIDPPIPIADHVHRLGIGCPDRELDTPVGQRMSPEPLPQPSMCALAEEVEIVFTEQHDGKRT
jgi:hypothetical protein